MNNYELQSSFHTHGSSFTYAQYTAYEDQPVMLLDILPDAIMQSPRLQRAQK